MSRDKSRTKPKKKGKNKKLPATENVNIAAVPDEQSVSGTISPEPSIAEFSGDNITTENEEDFNFVDPDEMIGLRGGGFKSTGISVTNNTAVDPCSAYNEVEQKIEEHLSSSLKNKEPDENDDGFNFIDPDEMIDIKYGSRSEKRNDSGQSELQETISSEDLMLLRLMDNMEGPKKQQWEKKEDTQKESQPPFHANEHLRASMELAEEIARLDQSETSPEEESAGPEQIPGDMQSESDKIITSDAAFTTPGGKMTPQDVDTEDKDQDEEQFIPLDLPPIFTESSGIFSPETILKPDEMGETDSFVSRALPKDTVISERYKIIKVLSEKREWNTYKVADLKTENKKLIMKEYITSDMNRDEYRSRRDVFRDTVRILSTFSHPNLVTVYEAFTENYRDYYLMEVVEGLTVTSLADMNTKPFSEKEVLKWGCQLCEAVEFMHYRPTPFTLGNIKPNHIMVDQEGKVRITGHDLQRFFDLNRTLEFRPDDPKKLYDDITKVARIIFFLLTKIQYPENVEGMLEIEWPAGIKPKMIKLMEKSCREGQRTYGDIKEFLIDLQDTQVEKTEDAIRRRFFFPSHKLDFTWVKNGFQKIASQHPLLIGIEAVFLLFIIFMFSAVHIKSIYSRPAGPLAYVSTTDGTIILKADSFEPLEKILMEKDVSLIYPLRIDYVLDKEKKPENIKVLLIGNQKHKVMKIINSQNLEELTGFPAEVFPEKIISNPDGDTLYALHPYSDMISVISVKELRLKRFFPAGKRPVGIIYKEERTTPDSTDVDKTAEKNRPAIDGEKKEEPISPEMAISKGTLIVSNSDSSDILFLDCETGHIRHQIILEGAPGAMVYVRDRGEVIFADTGMNRLGFLNLEKMEVTGYVNLPGKNPSDIVYDYGRKLLWITQKESNGLSVYDLSKDEFISFPQSGEDKGIKTAETIKTGIGNSPEKLYLEEAKDRLWVMNGKSRNIAIIDLKTNEVIKRIDLGQTPQAFCIENE